MRSIFPSDYNKLVGEKHALVRGKRKNAVLNLYKAIHTTGVDDYHMNVATAMATVARLWVSTTSTPIPIFVEANNLMEKDGEPVTIDWA
jgi:hypothetical protein